MLAPRIGRREAAVFVALASLATSVAGQQFAPLPDQLPTGTPGRAVLVDLDGDGDLDLVGVRSGQNGSIWTQDGHGVFADESSRLPPNNSFSEAVATADVDADGDLDLFVANAFDQNVLLLQAPDGSFVDATASRLPARFDASQCAAFGDVDGDGDLDLVVGNQFADDALLLNDGAGTFTDAPSGALPSSSDNTKAVLLVDLDADGDLDLVAANDRTSNRLLRNDGNGAFTVDGSFPTDGDGDFGVAAGDVDGDGRLDLVFANAFGANRLLRQSAIGTFVDESFRLPASVNDRACFDVALVDVDLDGDADLVLANSFGQDQLWLNDGTGVFVDAASRLPQTLDASTRIAVGDLDRDGDPDLVIGDRPGGVLFNRLRQLVAVDTPTRGQDWTLRISSAPGFESAATPPAAVVFVGFAELDPSPAVPPFGRFALDPAFTLTFGPFPIPAPAGELDVAIPIPDVPVLAGLDLFAQAFVVSAVGRIRLTNRIASSIL
jgi:hypothetical protein